MNEVPPVSFLIHPIRDTYKLCGHSQRKNPSREIIKVGKSSAEAPGTRAQPKRHPRNNNYDKMLNKAVCSMGALSSFRKLLLKYGAVANAYPGI